MKSKPKITIGSIKNQQRRLQNILEHIQKDLDIEEAWMEDINKIKEYLEYAKKTYPEYFL